MNIPEGNAIGRSYEDASLRDELSADADKAFKLAELESKLLSQESNLGYFGANKKPSKDQVMNCLFTPPPPGSSSLPAAWF